MKNTVLLTGATGTLGTEIAAKLVRDGDTNIVALVRAESREEACHRLRGAWYHDRALSEAVGSSVSAVPFGLTKEGLGLSGEDRHELEESVTHIIHAAADTSFKTDRAALESVNRDGTGRMIKFASKCRNLARFTYISTAYVCGSRKGLIMESETGAGSYLSSYEQSKAEAEMLVRDSGLSFTVCRPGMIVGDSRTGWVRNFNTVYYILKKVLLGQLKVMPVSKDTLLNIVPADYVADCVIKAAFSEKSEGRTYHLTCPDSMAPSAAELADHVRQWALRRLGTNTGRMRFLPLPALKKAGEIYNRKHRGENSGSLLSLAPYFFSDRSFDRTEADALTEGYHYDWKNYIDVLLEFAVSHNFMRQSGQTVFEQARARRASSRYPINYYDVGGDGIHPVSGAEVNRRIEKVLEALYAWGIEKGDRIALTGINSVDYLVLEQALGLLGAVSVPIYYTSPADEVSLLLDRSGSKWFFIGDNRMMSQAPSVRTKARMVAFSVAKDYADGDVMPWNEFMAKERPAEEKARQYPDPDDLATIRYTSGTTGEPKGVMFSFGQLAWMGGVLTELLTWEDRNRSMTYLSFLPLSHVVEGILASYAPYYALCRVDYYYLNDFSSLTGSLPAVRPNVFFSVPRFYEKVWEQVLSNPMGRAWAGMKEGALKRALGAVIRRVVLRKAGIDRCKQLIVGSAPVSEMLLKNFRELGIEIYNAYGQTEAPLITINRLGDNVIPTIGTPLPETQVTCEEDGELIVRGPQVTLGYYGLESDSIRDGVLRTGDLGSIGDDGHITLFGRKKDFVVTAYGKNISITKLEEKLKDIPQVSEAVLIGEGRPYCTALLWLDGEEADLGEQIDSMNGGLSHPEQIRRYRIIERPLSIGNGELTPNLKVKRRAVEEHFSKEIEEMYS